jgi:hypothetical protein
LGFLQETKASSEFSPDRRRGDGLRGWCKVCERVARSSRYHRAREAAEEPELKRNRLGPSTVALFQLITCLGVLPTVLHQCVRPSILPSIHPSARLSLCVSLSLSVFGHPAVEAHGKMRTAGCNTAEKLRRWPRTFMLPICLACHCAQHQLFGHLELMGAPDDAPCNVATRCAKPEGPTDKLGRLADMNTRVAA